MKEENAFLSGWAAATLSALPFDRREAGSKTEGTSLACCRRQASLQGLTIVSRKEYLVASRLNPYISFTGNARQAMEFYEDVFGGTLTLNTFGEFGAPDSPGADNIMHAMLETDSGFALMGADTQPEMELNPGDNIAVSLSGDDGDELRGYWEKLSGSGSVSVTLEKQMWGDEFGMCVDQFGIAWMVNIAQSQI